MTMSLGERDELRLLDEAESVAWVLEHDEEGRFVESYPEYQSTPRAWTFALSNARNEELPLLLGEMLNEIMREDHYAWPVDHTSDD